MCPCGPLFYWRLVTFFMVFTEIAGLPSIDLKYADNIAVVKPLVYKEILRKKRAAYNIFIEDNPLTFIKVGNWTFELSGKGNMILAPTFKAEWVDSDGQVHIRNIPECEYTSGNIRGLKPLNNSAVFTICGSLITGYFDIGGAGYFLQPLNETSGTHLLYTSIREENGARPKRSHIQSTDSSSWIFNLTGDTFELEAESGFENQHTDNDMPPKDNNHEFSERLFLEDYDRDDNGYFFDAAWASTGDMLQTSHRNASSLPQRWLEIALAVDHTVISFHGRTKVEQYVLALMNIVSAIYQDTSLEANLKLVITKLTMFEHKKTGVIKAGQAKKSLENVNHWNRKLHGNLAPGEPKHDIAIWLTRSDIGGPSGYAPVGGVCDPKRSCTLNRDEGLTSAFIIAHEVAHTLGLSHDGDTKGANHCDSDANDGSVMAAMVSATFNKFFWSDCSRREFRERISRWTCLLNPPANQNEILLNASLRVSFSMDEQCRMEFGDGYSMCRSFDIVEPCTHLWCSHKKTPMVCKTKKGPPLEGTECGFGKWCVGGYCEDVGHRELPKVPITLNPRDGAWSVWSPWEACSRTCGLGVQFRQRQCDNPPPSYGGKNCEGKQEEWRLCQNNPVCSDFHADIRAEQCKRLPTLLGFKGKPEGNDTWLPFESEKSEEKCKLICISEEKKQLYETKENLLDGTPCTYENEDDICVQGECQQIGCDGKLQSNLRRDICGVCGGDESYCAQIKLTNKRRLKREVSRVAVIPRMSREIRVETNVTLHGPESLNIAFILKNRRRKKYTVTVPNTSIYTKILDGANFFYTKTGDKHDIWAKGPVLSEMIIMLVSSKSDVEKGLSITYQTEYSIHKEFQKPSKRFVWILGGWGSCSASCGGGRRQKTMACWDSESSKLVKRKFCSLIEKPHAEFEKCNTFSCNFQWVAGEWEPCSKTCGTTGIQHRELYCVPNSALGAMIYEGNTTLFDWPWKIMVSPSKCPGYGPASMRSCNRRPCPSYWVFGEWSKCSVSCGPGISSRTSTCLPPDEETFYTCGEAPPPQRQPCMGNFTRHNSPNCKGRKQKFCTQDASKYCSFKVLKKYCQLNIFRRMCCKSCATEIITSNY